jgi:hypothetical protein
MCAKSKGSNDITNVKVKGRENLIKSLSCKTKLFAQYYGYKKQK